VSLGGQRHDVFSAPRPVLQVAGKVTGADKSAYRPEIWCIVDDLQLRCLGLRFDRNALSHMKIQDHDHPSARFVAPISTYGVA
jgi:hypothetical protein